MIIAVDGASGTGKSTICKLVALELDLGFLDTGAIYRAIALAVKENKVDIKNEEALKNICRTLNLSFEFKNGNNSVYLGKRDISEDIRTPEISMLSSSVSAIPFVRQAVLEIQRRFAKGTKKHGIIADGRDMGTVVFPKAEVKIFLTASSEVSAKRRYKELKEKGLDVKYDEILKETIQRDKRDRERKIAPLKKAPDAIEVNTDNLDINGVKERIKSIIAKVK